MNPYFYDHTYVYQGPSMKHMAHSSWGIFEELKKGLFIKVWEEYGERARERVGQAVGTPQPLLGPREPRDRQQ